MEKGEGRSVGGLSPFSHLSHTQMFGEERRSRRRIGERTGGAEKVKETTFEEETKKRRKASNGEKDQEIELRAKDGE